jgi:hypothetical protein
MICNGNGFLVEKLVLDYIDALRRSSGKFLISATGGYMIAPMKEVSRGVDVF